MQLRLQLGSEPPQRLVVEVDGAPSGRDLLDALTAAGLLPPALRRDLRMHRTGRLLEVTSSLDALGLRDGDLLTAGPRRAAPTTAAGATTRPEAVLVVGSGPDEGRVQAITPTGLVVGRDATSNFVLDDPGLSRTHLKVAAREQGWTVRDLGSHNGTFHAGFRVGDRPVEVVPGLPVEAGNTLLRVEESAPLDEPRIVVKDGVGLFNRSPRVSPPPRPTRFDLPTPPRRPTRMRIPILAAFAPALIAPIFVLMGGGLGFLAIALLSPLTILVAWWEDRTHGHKDHRIAVADYRRTLDDTERTVAAAVRSSAQARWAAAPDPRQLATRATPTTALWERRPHDEDFLTLRFGWGEEPTDVSYTLGADGDPELTREVRRRLDPLLISGSTPLVVDLREVGHLGVVTEPGGALNVQAWPLLQLAVLTSPAEVHLAAAVPDGRPWQWLERLPHSRWRAGGAVAAGDVAARELVREIGMLVEERSARSRDRLGGDRRTEPTVVLLVDDEVALPRNLATAVLEDGPAVGVHVIWSTDSAAGVPGQCGALVETSGALVDATWTRTGRRLERASLDQVRPETLEEVSWSLTGLRDASARDRRAEVPTRVSLVDTLGMTTPTADHVLRRWGSSVGLGAPLGLGAEGPVDLDLRRDGPHALLGGTTGAGKSELLQTLVGSLAATNPPDRLTFLLVDYKGGAAFKDCEHLPHTVGMVTDLDGHLVSRVLVSLGAELSHREHVLAGVGAKDLLDMQQKAPDRAPPSLLLVVDEFAALATELPEFVDGMVSLAQRGRSLGMHLLLATQRPAGAINDNIRANTNLRISLRMNDREDSDDVIGSPLAAALPRSIPGRAYVRTGSTELVEVQVAYSGGHAFGAADTAARVTVSVPGRAAPPPPPAPDVAPPATDLQVLVDAVGAAFTATGAARPRVPWLPPLPAELAVGDLEPGRGTEVVVGLRDEPERQAQVAHRIDVVRDGGLLVVGSGRTGRTTVLRTLAGRLADQTSPAELHLAALDFGARGLAALGALPHVSDVLTHADEARVVRFLMLLERRMTRRREEMSDLGASSFDQLRTRQRERGLVPTPDVVVLLDGLPSFLQAFDRVDHGVWTDRLPGLISDGRAVGIHWVVTSDRRAATPLAVQSALPQRLVLRFHETDEYDSYGLPRDRTSGVVLPPGRAFGPEGHEVQVAVLGSSPAPEDQDAALTGIGARLRERHAGVTGPEPVRLLGTEVPAPPPGTARMSAVPIGQRDVSFDPAVLDLERSSLLVCGAKRSGKSQLLRIAARELAAAADPVELVLLMPRTTPLEQLAVWSAVHRGRYPCADAVEDVLADLDDRPTDAPWLVVVVDDAEEFLDEAVDQRLAELVSRGADHRVRVLAAADKSAALRSFGGLLRRLRAERTGVVLQPDPDVDDVIFDGPMDRRHRGGPPGRALLAGPEGSQLLQVYVDAGAG